MIEDINGVGEKTKKVLEKLGIFNIYNLLTYYPFRYQIYQITPLVDGQNVVIDGLVESIPKIFYIRKNFNKLSFRALINNKIINVIIFNRNFLKNNLNVNRYIVIIGKYDEKKNTIIASDIKFENIGDLKIESIYHLCNGITNKRINQIITNALLNNNLQDTLPNKYIENYSFLSFNAALNKIHNPNNIYDIKSSKLRLIYQELFDFMFKINYLKIKRKVINDCVIKSYDENKFNEYINSLPFELSPDQKKATDDILRDFKSKTVLNRLVLGDVGSGKTVVAVNAIYANYLSGYESILMAPTEILAYQHYNSITNLLKTTNMNIRIITGSTTKKDKEIIYNEIKNNKIDLLIGTHSVLNEKIVFNNLGLVITDEQHRFGVRQRNILHDKGNMCDVLYLSATPIPRTYALTLYGDMDISLIKTKPNGRKEIKTKVFKYDEIKTVLYSMLDEIKKGHQIFVVCPLIDEGEDSNLTSVMDLKNSMDEAFNGKVSIGILHGKLSSKEKDHIMENFKKNKIKILISTTVVEVGIDIKNATMMVIFDANRFGLATLHQLRGRVGRNDLDCYCYLISRSETERLKVMEESNDGFYISEKDFELRGSGNLFGVEQSGDMTFKLANLKNDYKILLQASHDSEEYLMNNEYINNDYYIDIINKINTID